MLFRSGNKPQKRHAALAMNLDGGGGFEIWQYSERKPQPPLQSPQLGDLGIFSAKIRCFDITKAHNHIESIENKKVTSIQTSPASHKHFFVKTLLEIRLMLLKPRMAGLKENHRNPLGLHTVQLLA